MSESRAQRRSIYEPAMTWAQVMSALGGRQTPTPVPHTYQPTQQPQSPPPAVHDMRPSWERK